jgi:rSAM/selenodomain-associated transferase 1
MNPAILFFVKHPTPGKVKTRLAARVGAEQACEIYRRLAEKVCGMLPRDAQIFVAFDPPKKRREIEKWIGPLLDGDSICAPKFIPQSDGNLGKRIVCGFDEVFAAGHDKAAVIGSDCIDIGAKIFDTTWLALDDHDCVIGPAMDGGYYLLALRRACPGMFEKIAWSTDSTLLDTLQRARELGLNVFLLPLKSDIDTERDWLRVRARFNCK